MTRFAVTTPPVTVSRPLVPRPTPVQRDQIRQILLCCPRLVAGGNLVLVYTPDRSVEASWLCAYARAGEVAVHLAKVAPSAYSVQREACAQTNPQTTCIVLADMTVALPAGAVQLAGTASIRAIDLWRPHERLVERAETFIRDMPAEMSAQFELPTTGARLCVRHRGWTAVNATVEAELDGADGTFVADGAIAVNRPLRWDARLSQRPVTLTIRDGVVTTVACPDPVVQAFLRRAVHTHRTELATSLRIGVHPVGCGFSAIAGPVNVSHPGVTLRLRVDESRAFSVASADLRIDLTATWDGA